MKITKINKIISSSSIICIICLFFQIAFAEQQFGSVTGLPIPRFVIIKSRDANMRSGPGIQYEVKINYKCISVPVEIVNEFDTWRLVRDIYGNEGWIHEAILNGKRYIQIKNNIAMEEVLLLRMPDEKANTIARIQAGAIGKLHRCIHQWCQVSFGRSYKGWIHKNKLWGVYASD